MNLIVKNLRTKSNVHRALFWPVIGGLIAPLLFGCLKVQYLSADGEINYTQQLKECREENEALRGLLEQSIPVIDELEKCP